MDNKELLDNVNLFLDKLPSLKQEKALTNLLSRLSPDFLEFIRAEAMLHKEHEGIVDSHGSELLVDRINGTFKKAVDYIGGNNNYKFRKQTSQFKNGLTHYIAEKVKTRQANPPSTIFKSELKPKSTLTL